MAEEKAFAKLCGKEEKTPRKGAFKNLPENHSETF